MKNYIILLSGIFCIFVGAITVEPVERFSAPCSRVVKESRLPYAAQTHEVVHLKDSDVFLISQMSDGVLVKAKNTDGYIVDQRGFLIGGNGSGIHGLGLSELRPGLVWGTLENLNQVFLFDPHAESLDTPPEIITSIDLPENASGPHYISEYGNEIWISLRESNHVLRISISNTSDYSLYKCEPRPIFVAHDPNNAELYYANQDNSDQIFVVNVTSGNTNIFPIPPQYGSTPVGIVSGPLGVWFVLLGTNETGTGTFARINGNGEFVYFKLSSPLGMNASLLHLAFDEVSTENFEMWLLGSSIVKTDALDMLIRVQFDENWSTILNEEVLLMPTQRSMVHRILPVDYSTIYVTELSTSRLASFSLEKTAQTTGSCSWSSNDSTSLPGSNSTSSSTTSGSITSAEGSITSAEGSTSNLFSTTEEAGKSSATLAYVSGALILLSALLM